MQGFKSAGGAKFLSFHAAAYYIFNVQRHLIFSLHAPSLSQHVAHGSRGG
jgi:hypothetical protein